MSRALRQMERSLRKVSCEGTVARAHRVPGGPRSPALVGAAVPLLNSAAMHSTIGWTRHSTERVSRSERDLAQFAQQEAVGTYATPTDEPDRQRTTAKDSDAAGCTVGKHSDVASRPVVLPERGTGDPLRL